MTKIIKNKDKQEYYTFEESEKIIEFNISRVSIKNKPAMRQKMINHMFEDDDIVVDKLGVTA